MKTTTQTDKSEKHAKAAPRSNGHASKASLQSEAPLHPILRLQQTIGNQAVLRLMRAGKLQAKLAISQPGDVYEQEADRVADQVMRMPDSTIQRACGPCAAGGGTCPKCAGAKKEPLPLDRVSRSAGFGGRVGVKGMQRQPEFPTTDHSVFDNFVSGLGSGRPLDASTRSFFEPRFGTDFSHVRVHTDSRAAESARAVNALAFTVGRDMVFGAGQYAPQTSEGRHLLAHELTHTVQQGDRADPILQRDCDNPDFCKPYKTTAEADSAEWWIKNTYLRAEGIETFGTAAKGLYESFLSRSPGDSLTPVVFDSDSSYLVSSFRNSGDTTDDMDNVIDLVGNRLSRAPGPPLRDNSPTMMSLSNFLSSSEMGNRPINYSNPLSVAGHIAGGIGSSDAGADYRKITYANVTLEKTTLIGSTGYVSVKLTPHYEVFDAIDFCPGDCGSPAEQLVTVPMSRLEASGAAYDVPFKVIFTPESRSKRFWF